VSRAAERGARNALRTSKRVSRKWGKAAITLWTHKIDGLTESDFSMAAKIDRLSSE